VLTIEVKNFSLKAVRSNFECPLFHFVAGTINLSSHSLSFLICKMKTNRAIVSSCLAQDPVWPIANAVTFSLPSFPFSAA
jgi:hypothetical protein